MDNEFEKNINEEIAREQPVEQETGIPAAEESDSTYRWKPEDPAAARWQPEDSAARWQPEPVPAQPKPRPEKPKKKKGFSAKRVVALALCCAVLGGIIGAGGTMLGFSLLNGGSGGTKQQNISGMLQGLRENTVIQLENVDTSKEMSPAEVYAANVNSTVTISGTIYTNSWGGQQSSYVSGSGFVISQDGYILTNYHVVEGTSKIEVEFYSGDSYVAKLIGYDAGNDIAVLKVEANDLSPVILGDSDNLNVGDTVVAIGNPLGILPFSLTAGIVSAKDQAVPMSDGSTMQLLQTDCAINSGNSGGALFNLHGEVIGITNSKFSSSGSGTSIDNLSFAIPMNRVKDMVFSIIEKGYVAKPYIGVTVTSVSEELQSYGLPKGASIEKVAPDSPAQTAGLRVSDIVTAVDGKEIADHTEFVALVGAAKTGDSMVLTVYRRGTTVEITVVIGEQIQSATGN